MKIKLDIQNPYTIRVLNTFENKNKNNGHLDIQNVIVPVL
jgi:hypothetical protein